MNRNPSPHLSPDDVDAWLVGRLSHSQTSHLETCLECREVVESEGELVRQLAALPMLAPSPNLVGHVMARLAQTRPALARAARHVNAEELDAFLVGNLEQVRLWHIEDCAECLEFAEAEQALVARLVALPLYGPEPGFSDRVLAGLTVPVAAAAWSATSWRERIFASRKSLALAASLGLLVTGSMAGSIVWSLGHQATIATAGSWLWGQAGQMMWIGLRGAASNLFEQPWYSDLRQLIGSPSLLAACSALAFTTYVGCVLALRRLLTVPMARVVA